MPLPPLPPPSGIDAELYRQLYAFEYLQVMTVSVLAWEIIVTLPMEIGLYRRGFRPILLLLTLSRWYTLGCVIVDLGLNMAEGATPQFCHNARWILSFLSVTIQFVSIPLLLIRTYAIWDKSKIIAAILFILWMGGLIIGIYVSTLYEGVPYSVFLQLDVVGGCGADPKNQWGTAPFVVNMITDSSVFLLTLGRLISIKKKTALTRNRITHILLRDGIIYYFVVVAINVVNIIFFLAPGLPPLARPLIAGPATVAPAIMVGRLFFNLQYSFLSPNGAASSTHSTTAARPNITRQGGTIATFGERDTVRNRDIYPLGPLNVTYSVDVKSDTSPPEENYSLPQPPQQYSNGSGKQQPYPDYV